MEARAAEKIVKSIMELHKEQIMMRLAHGVKELIPKTMRGSLLYVTIATFTNNFVNFIIQIAAARALGVREFGVLSLAFSVTLLTGAIGEFGLNLATIRLFNKYNDDPKKQKILLGSVLAFRTAIFVSLLIIAVPVGHFLARSLSDNDSNWILFGIALATGGLILFWTYLQSIFQCYRQFNKLAVYTMLYSGLRFAALTIACNLIGGDSLTWLLVTYTIPTAMLFVVGFIPIFGKLLSAPILAPQSIIATLKEVIGYSKWVALSGIAYMVMPHAVRFILAARASITEVGIFSAGMTFAVAFTTLNTAVRAVLFPQVTALEGHREMKRYLARLKKIAPYYAVFVALGIVTLGFLQRFILGEAYLAALPVFLITAGAFAVVFFVSLGTMLIHTMMRPEVETYIDLIRFCLVALFTFLIAPKGAMGVAIVYAIFLIVGTASKFLVIRRWLYG